MPTFFCLRIISYCPSLVNIFLYIFSVLSFADDTCRHIMQGSAEISVEPYMLFMFISMPHSVRLYRPFLVFIGIYPRIRQVTAFRCPCVGAAGYNLAGIPHNG